MKKRIVVLLFFLNMLLLPSMAQAVDTVVIATDYWPPFRIRSDAGITGIDIELLTLVGERMGVNFVVQQMPWVRCLLNMEHGTADVMVGLAKTPGREKYIAYTARPYYTCAPAIYERKGRSGNPIFKYEDLVGQQIAYTRGSAYFEPFDSDKRLLKIEGRDELQLIQMVKDGRWDLFIGTDCQVDYDLVQLNLTDKIVKTPYRPEVRVSLYVGLSKKSSFSHRLAELNAILEELLDAGIVKALADKYIKKHDAISSNPAE